MGKVVYETPATEVVAVRIENSILSVGVQSARTEYGRANQGVSGVDEGSEWVWE